MTDCDSYCEFGLEADNNCDWIEGVTTDDCKTICDSREGCVSFIYRTVDGGKCKMQGGDDIGDVGNATSDRTCFVVTGDIGDLGGVPDGASCIPVECLPAYVIEDGGWDSRPPDCEELAELKTCVPSTTNNCTQEELESIQAFDCDSDTGDYDQNSGNNDGAPTCIPEACLPPGGYDDGPPNCDELTDLFQCMDDIGAREACSDEDEALIATWTACICEAQCDDVPTGDSIDTDNLILLADYSDPWFSPDFHPGMSWTPQAYSSDPMKNFFRFDLDSEHSWTGKPSVWDQFSAFYAVKYEYFAPQDKCLVFVKVTGLDDEEFHILNEIDGVNVNCILEQAFSEKHLCEADPSCTNHESTSWWGWFTNPLTVILNWRVYAREYSGAAPTTDYDDPNAYIQLSLSHPDTPSDIVNVPAQFTHAKWKGEKGNSHATYCLTLVYGI